MRIIAKCMRWKQILCVHIGGAWTPIERREIQRNNKEGKIDLLDHRPPAAAIYVRIGGPEPRCLPPFICCFDTLGPEGALERVCRIIISEFQHSFTIDYQRTFVVFSFLDSFSFF